MTTLRDVRILTLLVASALVASGCQVVGGYDVFERSEPSKPARQTGVCDAIASSKTGDDDRNLLLIEDPYATCFWMDKAEVTVSEYRVWLSDLPGGVPDWGDSELCRNRISARARPFDPDQFDPDEPDPSCVVPDPPPFVDGPFDDELPIRCVDWCEAEAYCRWAGKRLCKVSTPTSNDEWYTACSAGYTQSYPFDLNAPGFPCNYGQTCASGCGPLPAQQDTQCRPASGYPLNLGGNVNEWVDECSVANGVCSTRGGSYLSTKTDLACSNVLGINYVEAREATIGFRCCASLTQAESSLLPD